MPDSDIYEEYRKRAIHALDYQQKIKNKIDTSRENARQIEEILKKPPSSTPRRTLRKTVSLNSKFSWRNLAFFEKMNERRQKRAMDDAREAASENLLFMCAVRCGCDKHSIPDQDRAIVNEAIRAQFPPNHIKLLLENNPRACESGGLVDHVDHPIHIACAVYRIAVRIIMMAYKEASSQPDKEGKLPFEIFLRNQEFIDISTEEFASTVTLFSKLDMATTMEVYRRRASVKQQVLLNCIIPMHLSH